MIKADLPISRRGLLAGVLGILSVRSEVWADDDDDAEWTRPPFFTDEHFDQWVAGDAGSLDRWYHQFEVRLIQEIDAIANDCGLSGPQKQKLTLAGQGDLKRLHDRVEAGRRGFHKIPRQRENRKQVLDFAKELISSRPFILAELFDGGSILAKSLAKTLTPKQLEAYAKGKRERWFLENRREFEAFLENEMNILRLTPDQRKSLVGSFANASIPLERGTEPRVMFMQIFSMVPDEEVRPILDNRQWTLYSNRRSSYQRRVRVAFANRPSSFLSREDDGS